LKCARHEHGGINHIVAAVNEALRAALPTRDEGEVTVAGGAIG